MWGEVKISVPYGSTGRPPALQTQHGPLLLWGLPALLPACPPFPSFALRSCGQLGLALPPARRLPRPPLAPSLVLQAPRPPCCGWEGPSPGDFSGTHPPNSPWRELKAPLPTGQDVSRFPLGGSGLGCPAVHCTVLLYFRDFTRTS